MNIFFSYAKINVGLQILNKRKDSYHNIHSLFLEISLADELIFTPSNRYQLSIQKNYKLNFPLDESNLITQSYNLMKEKLPSPIQDYKIKIKKKIPIGGGLGGGSSNAAIVLNALNQLWKLNFSNKVLLDMAKTLGADVPFFINGGMQFVDGIGDILCPIYHNDIKNYFFVLIVPSIHISTSWAFRKLNKSLHVTSNRNKFSPLSDQIEWEIFENDFERVIYETYPEIGIIKKDLKNLGALYAGLSGSGSTVFGVFDNHQKAKLILDKFIQYQSFITSPVFR